MVPNDAIVDWQMIDGPLGYGSYRQVAGGHHEPPAASPPEPAPMPRPSEFVALHERFDRVDAATSYAEFYARRIAEALEGASGTLNKIFILGCCAVGISLFDGILLLLASMR